MKKRNLMGWITALTLALTTVCGTGVVLADETEYVKGDANGDGYVGTEDMFHTGIRCLKLAYEGYEWTFPPMVEWSIEGADVNENGVVELADVSEIGKAIAGKNQWGSGYHKITADDKSEVTYEYDGEYVIASVSVKKLTDTAVIYDKSKVEYIDKTDNTKIEKYAVMGASYNNADLGFVDIVAIVADYLDVDTNARFGTIDLKFKVLDGSEELTFGSCTGAGYIQDNLAEGEAFADAAKKYEDALYTEDVAKKGSEDVAVTKGDVVADGKVNLEDAQKVLKIALKIEGVSVKAVSDAADVDSDGQVTLQDAQKVLKIALKIAE